MFWVVPDDAPRGVAWRGIETARDLDLLVFFRIFKVISTFEILLKGAIARKRCKI